MFVTLKNLNRSENVIPEILNEIKSHYKKRLNMDQILKYKKCFGIIMYEVSLIKRCLDANPSNRPTTNELLNFNNLPEPKNSDDYYERYDNIISFEYSESLQIEIMIDAALETYIRFAFDRSKNRSFTVIFKQVRKKKNVVEMFYEDDTTWIAPTNFL
ncbi:kinase-like domain-containing protein [Rhizophagus clarus]|uniref:Kinase-like domain-containing protein n=1 Tax=Rhizophagus clarus TaxID=94130 RepID=A0A8H3LJY9_9GLOM|nr:kinase-like domain-containing protein [Rhizophagus clarus]